MDYTLGNAETSKERGLMNKPNFFIVGAAKSGTTSLANYLGQHPSVYLSPVKEPFYFVNDYGMKDYNEYLSLFRRAGDARVIGEASTGYLFDKTSATNISKSLPGSKVLMILRNPSDMAHSLWRHMSARGNENLSFEMSITDSQREFRKGMTFMEACVGWWCNYLYLERGLYCGQVKRYLHAFPRDNVKICIYEKFFEDLETSCREIFGFLGIDMGFVPRFKKLNEGGVARSAFIRKVISRKYPTLRSIVPLRERTWLRLFVQKMNLTKEKISPLKLETRNWLESFFRDDITCLERILGQEIPQWKIRDEEGTK